MTHAEQIFRAVVTVSRRNNVALTRKEVRDDLGLTQQNGMCGYTAIFQGTLDDHPGGAPDPGFNFRNVLHKVRYGRCRLATTGSGLAA